MLEVVALKKFIKDSALAERRGKDLGKLRAVIELLSSKNALPVRCRPHKLSGEWSSFWECHIEPDWLLIYDVTETSLILYRTGTHADLFK